MLLCTWYRMGPRFPTRVHEAWYIQRQCESMGCERPSTSSHCGTYCHCHKVCTSRDNDSAPLGCFYQGVCVYNFITWRTDFKAIFLIPEDLCADTSSSKPSGSQIAVVDGWTFILVHYLLCLCFSIVSHCVPEITEQDDGLNKLKPGTGSCKLLQIFVGWPSVVHSLQKP